MVGRHEMVHSATTASGAYEWSCTQCSRRLLLRWPPNYEKLVLDRGDESAMHGGGTSGLAVETNVARLPLTPGEDDHTWLAEHGMDWGAKRSA